MIKKSCSFLILIGIFMLNLTFASASFNVRVGNIYTYEVLDSKLDSSFGGEDFNVTGFRIGGNHFEIGKKFKANVTETTSSAIRYELICDEFSEEYIFTTFEIISEFNYYVTFPLNIANELINDDNLFDYLAIGLNAYYIPFVDTSTENFDDIFLVLEGYLSTLTTNQYLLNYESLSDSKLKNNQYINEWYIDFTIDYDENYSYSLKNSFRFVYSSSDGILLGSKMYGIAEGILDGVTFQVIFSQHIEQLEFDIGNFQLGDFATGNGKACVLLSLIALMPIILFKRKKKKKINQY